MSFVQSVLYLLRYNLIWRYTSHSQHIWAWHFEILTLFIRFDQNGYNSISKYDDLSLKLWHERCFHLNNRAKSSSSEMIIYPSIRARISLSCNYWRLVDESNNPCSGILCFKLLKKHGMFCVLCLGKKKLYSGLCTLFHCLPPHTCTNLNHFMATLVATHSFNLVCWRLLKIDSQV